MNSIRIRPAVLADAAEIDAVHRAAFPTDAEARLVALLIERGKAVVSLVAEEAGQVVGHIVFSPAQCSLAQCSPAVPAALDPANINSGLGLAPVAVLPHIQNRGIGSALIYAGLDECRRLAAPWVVVLGHAEFYPRFGFAPASRWNLTGDYGVSDAFQFLPLADAARGICGGHVSYAPEFAEIFAA